MLQLASRLEDLHVHLSNPPSGIELRTTSDLLTDLRALIKEERVDQEMRGHYQNYNQYNQDYPTPLTNMRGAPPQSPMRGAQPPSPMGGLPPLSPMGGPRPLSPMQGPPPLSPMQGPPPLSPMRRIPPPNLHTGPEVLGTQNMQ